MGADRASWDEMLAHGRFVRSLARALVRDDHLADDVVQDTWLAAARRPPADGKRAGGWLRRVATNVVRQLRRTERRRTQREHAIAATVVGPDATSASAEALDTQRVVIECLRALDEKYRTIVVLRFYEGLPTRAIAQRLGLPPATVRTQLARALAKLRIALDERFGGSRERWCGILLPWAESGAPIALVATAGAAAALLFAAVFWARSSLESSVEAGAGRVGAVAIAACGPAKMSEPGSSEAFREPPGRPAPARTTGSAWGRVVDDFDQPLAGASVELHRALIDAQLGFEPLRLAMTADDGTFRLEEVELETHCLVVRKPGFAPVTKTASLSARWRDWGDAAIRLPEARGLRGVVLDPEGRAVPGAWLVVGWEGRHVDLLLPEARSDEHGEFELKGLPLAEVTVGVFARGWRPDRFGAFGFESTDVECVLEAEEEPARLELAVSDSEAAPIAGARVWLHYVGRETREPRPLWLPAGIRRAFTSTDGSYMRDDLPAGEYELTVFADGHRFNTGSRSARLEPGVTTQLAVQSRATPDWERVRGRLLLEDGEPLAGCTLAFAARDFPPNSTIATDEDGGFEFDPPVSSGEPFLIWSLDEDVALIAPDAAGGLVSTRAAASAEIELIAAPAATISGRVVDIDGAPLPGVTLAIDGSTHAWNKMVSKATSGPDGRFEVRGLAPQPQPVVLVLEDPRAPTRIPGEIEIVAGGSRDDLVVNAPRRASLVGRVVDENGEPRRGWYVKSRDTPDPSGAVTGSDGRFAIHGLEPRSHRFAASENGSLALARGQFVVTIEDDGDPEEVTFMVPGSVASPGTIGGSVVDHRGRSPDSDGTMVLVCGDGPTHLSSTRGGFRFEGLPDIEYLAWAWWVPRGSGGDYELANVMAMSEILFCRTGASDLDLRLCDPDRSGRVAVSIESPDGVALPDQIEWSVGRVDPRSPERCHGFGGRGAIVDGLLELRGFAPGRYRLGLQGAGHSVVDDAPFEFEIAGTETLDLGTWEFVAPPRLRVIVVDGNGAPIPDARYLVSSRNMPTAGGRTKARIDQVEASAGRADDSGEFEVETAEDWLTIWFPGCAPRTFLPGDWPGQRDTPSEVTLLPAGHLEFVNVPIDLQLPVQWRQRLRSLEPLEARHGYAETYGVSAGSLRATDGRYHLPIGRYEIELWRGESASFSSRDEPPADLEPGVYGRWTVEVRAGETTRIDLAEEWRDRGGR